MLVGDFSDHFNLDARAEGNLSHSKSAARVSALCSENFLEELRSTIGYHVLFSERGRAVNQHHHLYDPAEFIEVTHCSIQSAEKVDGNSPRSPLSLRSRDITAELASPRFTIPLCDMAGDINQVAGSDEWNKGRSRRSNFGKND